MRASIQHVMRNQQSDVGINAATALDILATPQCLATGCNIHNQPLVLVVFTIGELH